MKATLQKYWEGMQTSYWFIPSLMTVGAIVLSFVATELDVRLGSAWIHRVDWINANEAAGARAVLSTIAGSMITVAGVTFSITIAAVSYATGEFGPRLLLNFMRDRGNQITLGTFIATFIYCLLVLRTIRGASETVAGSGFIPHIALTGAMGFALASIGVLIFFIHHVPEMIHASGVIAEIGRDLNVQIEQVFPEALGYGAPEEAYDAEKDVPAAFFEEAVAIRMQSNGYIQHINEGGLLRVARQHDLLLRVQYRPGDFVNVGKPLVLAWPSDRVDDNVAAGIRGKFAWGGKRTPTQDLMFLVNELVEIAARALSPGVNDPFTAISCMDWLGSALAGLARRSPPDALRYDEDRELRVIAQPITFARFARAVFDQLRPYVKADINAALHMMKMIGEVAYGTDNTAYREVLMTHATALKEGCEQTLTQERDLQALDKRYRTLVRLITTSGTERSLADEHEWLAGGA